MSSYPCWERNKPQWSVFRRFLNEILDYFVRTKQNKRTCHRFVSHSVDKSYQGQDRITEKVVKYIDLIWYLYRMKMKKKTTTKRKHLQWNILKINSFKGTGVKGEEKSPFRFKKKNKTKEQYFKGKKVKT